MVCFPVRYVPLAIVWSVVDGWMPCAPCVVSCFVPLPVTVIVPAVPEDTYPADTDGVTDWVFDTVAVISPLELTLTVGLAVIVVAGVFADPDATDADS